MNEHQSGENNYLTLIREAQGLCGQRPEGRQRKLPGRMRDSKDTLFPNACDWINMGYILFAGMSLSKVLETDRSP